jgi:hypothetical protein
LKHNDGTLNIDNERAEFLAFIENTNLYMLSGTYPITLEEIEHVFRICGQDNASGPSGLTVRHFRRANIAKYLLSVFNKAIKKKKPQKTREKDA